MFEYFYHEIFRRTVIAFGTLFNDISVKKTDSSGNVVSVVKVPLAYGPTQKFLARLEQSPDLSKPTQITLPRMSFELTGLNYDPGRKVTTTQTFVTKNPNDGTEFNKSFMPVPYNMIFELSIMCKLNDDALQIIEQILPYFQPHYNITVDLVSSMSEKRDIPVNLDSITMQDDYEGDYTTRRALIYTLRFTAKTYLFGPVSSVTKDIIKKSTISLIAGDQSPLSARSMVYSAEPRAIKNYTGIVLTNLAKDVLEDDTVIEVNDGSGIASGVYLEINGEEIYVKSITGNRLLVDRGRDSTTITSHVSGSEVKSITTADNALVEEGDDFGFSGSIL
jgi:hypothetical protein